MVRTPPKEKIPQSTRPKLGGHITDVLEEALKLYMSDNHLHSRTEVLNSALGRFLEAKGYIRKDPKSKEGFSTTTPDREAKRIGFHENTITPFAIAAAMPMPPPTNEIPSV